MRRWVFGVALGIIGAGVVACGERQAASPAGPVADVTALTTLPACDFNAMNPMVSQYFSSGQAKTARDLISAMATAGAGSAGARDRGFDVIAMIADNAQAGTGGSVQAGSNLINELTKCMFTDAAEFPATFPEDYTVALTTSQAGGLGVRGGATDPTVDPVNSRDLFSGVAPPSGVTWATMLSGNPAPSRLLVYGRPSAIAQHYDWKVLPRNTTFNPNAIVGVCVDVNAATTSMLNEEHVGILTFADAYFLNPATCSSFSFKSASWGERLAYIFLPKALSASTVNPGGIGGSTGGIGSDFGLNNIATVTLTFTVQPPATVTVGEPFTVQVRATDPGTGATVGGVRISIVANNNNGVPKELLGTTTLTTSNSGVATFTDLSFSDGSTGGYRLLASGGVTGRDAIGVNQAISTKVNAKPAK
ncbi:MAG TPA: hypothetical protein VGQ18_07460 [Gemmatimonadales bacterium]|jgi:hypothetical protein|nr:hypothetical protein [Gemmatimonadales bacterium]